MRLMALVLLACCLNVLAEPEAGQQDKPLWKAAQDGDVVRIQQLLDAKATLDDQQNAFKATPLMYAAGSGRLAVLKMLLMAGARPNLQDNRGATALWYAVKSNHVECVTELIAAGADPNIPSNDSSTPLILAARHETPPCLAALLVKRPDINVINNRGFSALMVAAGANRLENVKVLINAGADIDLENSDHETALIKAGQRGQMEMVKYLTSAGAKKTSVFLNRSTERDDKLTPAQRWALATSAMLAQHNGRSHETLAVGINDKRIYIKTLERDWSIKNREDLLKILDSLGTDSPDRRVHSAWNLCHYIWLVRAGYTVDYLTADESWQKIMPIAQRIQRNYNSWEEVGRDYMVVRQKVDKQDPASAEGYSFIFNLMIRKDDVNSPWNINPWETPLN